MMLVSSIGWLVQKLFPALARQGGSPTDEADGGLNEPHRSRIEGIVGLALKWLNLLNEEETDEGLEVHRAKVAR